MFPRAKSVRGCQEALFCLYLIDRDIMAIFSRYLSCAWNGTALKISTGCLLSWICALVVHMPYMHENIASQDSLKAYSENCSSWLLVVLETQPYTA